MIQQFFEIFNFRFWLFLFELFIIPTVMMIAGLIFEKKGSSHEIQ